MAQSKELTKFYQEYALWLEEGAPDKLPFWRQFALCASIRDYTENWDDSQKLNLEMKAQFIKAKLNELYPFNTPISFTDDSLNKSHYLNEKRIAWVHQHMKG